MAEYGPMAEAMFTAIRRAEQTQAATLEYLHAQYAVSDKPKDFYEMTFSDFIKEMDAAYIDGTIDQLNTKYAQVLLPLIQQIVQPQQQPQQ